MKPEEFINKLITDLDNNKDAFIKNMHNLNKTEHTFCEWVLIFSAWMEWNSDECENFYGEG